MKNTPLISPPGAKTFGRAAVAIERPDDATLMRRRLQGKIDNFEREARRLALRGEEDAAQVLERAANRIKLILRTETDGVAV